MPVSSHYHVSTVRRTHCLLLADLKIERVMPMEEPRSWLGLSARAWVSAAVAIGLLAWLTDFLIDQGPKKVDLSPISEGLTGEQWQIAHEIDDIEKRYREWPTDKLPPTGIEDDLARAIRWQEQLLAANPRAGKEQTMRLDRLQTARDTVLAQRQWDRVLALELTLKNDPTTESRIERLEELLKLRQTINRSRAEPRYKNLVRETDLDRELERLQVVPLREEADALATKAKEAADGKDWIAALQHYTRAREIMEEINRQYARSKFADLALRNRLFNQETSLQGAREAAEITLLITGGDAAANDRPEIAAEYFTQAMSLQKKLNKQWPLSRFVSTNRLDQLEVKRQTVSSNLLIAQMLEQDRELTESLTARQTWVSKQKLAELQAMALQLAENFPRSQNSDQGLGRKYAYLISLGDQLRQIQDGIYDQLVPLAGRAGQMLLRDEVSQELYTAIMKFNPSREPATQQAVESVSLEDATEFCRRLGWILGQAVRLPSREVMQSALNDRGAVDPAKSDTRDAYLNLVGGVSEWLAAEPSDSEAEIFTGETGGDLTVRRKDTRSRAIGFRVLLESGNVSRSD